MDRDYIIAFDENGEPYIAHALGSRLSGAASNVRRAGSRYLMKIQTKYGNRYFYTPQEVQAYQRAKSGVKKAADSAKSTVNSTKKQVNQTVKTLKSDLKKRQTWKNAEKEAASPLKDVKQIDKGWYQGRIETAAESAYDKKYAEATKKTYDKTKLGKAENAAKSAAERMKEEFRKKKEDVKDKLGYDERDAKSAVNNTKKQVNQTVKTLKSDLKKRQTWKNAEKEADSNLKPLRSSPDSRLKRDETKEEDAYDKAFAAATKKTYDKTKLGKAENVAKDKASSAIQSIKEQVKNLIPGAKVNGNKLVMPSGNEITIPEQFITEQIIPESFIEEQIIKEKKIEEKKSK